MTEEKLKSYLAAFYDGTSTPEQEQELRTFFASTADVPDEFKADAAMFSAMAAESADVPADLEARIISTTVGHRRTRNWIIYGAVAASAALIFVITAPPESSTGYREVTDPAEAEAITIQFAEKLQKSIDKLSTINNLPL